MSSIVLSKILTPLFIKRFRISANTLSKSNLLFRCYSEDSQIFLGNALNISIKTPEGLVNHSMELISPPNPQLVELLRKSILLQHTDISVKLYKQCCQELYHIIEPTDRSQLIKLIVKSIKALPPQIPHLDPTHKKPKPSKPYWSSEYLDWLVDDTIQRNKGFCDVFNTQDWNIIFEGWGKQSNFTRLEIALNCIIQYHYPNQGASLTRLKLPGNIHKLNELMKSWDWKSVPLNGPLLNSILMGRSKIQFVRMKPLFDLYEFGQSLGLNPDPSVIVIGFHKCFRSPDQFLRKLKDFIELKLNEGKTLNIEFFTKASDCLQSRGMHDESKTLLDHMINRLNITPNVFVLNMQIKNLFHLDDVDSLESLLSHYKYQYNVEPNQVTLSHILDGFGSLGDLETMELWYHRLVAQQGIKPGIPTYIHLIRAYGSFGEISKVDQLAQEYLGRPDLPIKVEPIHHLIKFYGSMQSFFKVRELYEILLRAQVKIPMSVWMSLIKACINCNEIEIGVRWLVESGNPKHLGKLEPNLVEILMEAGWSGFNNPTNNDYEEFQVEDAKRKNCTHQM